MASMGFTESNRAAMARLADSIYEPREAVEHDNDITTGANSIRPKQNLDLQHTKSLEHSVSLPHEMVVIGIISLAQFMTQVGLGQTLALLHIISDDFGITNPGIDAWLIAGYSLTVGTFILVSGRMGDVFGYKRMLIIGYIWFAVWELVAGLAVYSTYVLFIWARVLSGIGPSICLPNALALLGVLYQPGKRKNMAFALFGALAPTGSIVGAAFGGIFALAWWPWAFWSTALVLVAIAIIGKFAIPDPPRAIDSRAKTWLQLFHLCDPLGSITGVTALVLINFAWNQAPIAGWSSPMCIVTLVIGLLLLPAFFYIELHVTPNPLVPFRELNSDAGFVLACIGLGWGSFGIWVYYLWSQLLVLRGISPLLAAAYLSPLIIMGTLAAFVSGLLLHFVGPAWTMTGAMTAFLIGIVLVATAPVDQIYWKNIFLTSMITCWGMDMSFPAATIILSNMTAREHQGVAASLVNTIVNYSISLCLGFAGTVEVHVNNGSGTPEDVLKGYRGALYLGIGLAAMGLVVSLVFVGKLTLKDRRAANSGNAEKARTES
ncbi:hypothetical protein B0A48_09953 [Cryoendolithus antarcticus]|uniref:Major facilitator superfamily (MFS) profile domain-containing protein n=1 Tax=Cryoendolithus antarcticus TaxID=1507870 RepID=A0A1V8T3R1_9PEZI|nr:hypothetical protein B0A48_09953 [Cryoendolithus antarcticus]